MCMRACILLLVYFRPCTCFIPILFQVSSLRSRDSRKRSAAAAAAASATSSSEPAAASSAAAAVDDDLDGDEVEDPSNEGELAASGGAALGVKKKSRYGLSVL